MFSRHDNPLTLTASILIIAFILYSLLGVPPGLIDYDTQQAKRLLDACEKEHDELIKVTKEINEIKSVDIYRAYNECREDLNGIKTTRSFLGYFLFMMIILGSFISWYCTKSYYKNKLEDLTKKRK